MFCTSAKAATGVIRDAATGTAGRTRRRGS
jgi:hypothetical protein